MAFIERLLLVKEPVLISISVLRLMMSSSETSSFRFVASLYSSLVSSYAVDCTDVVDEREPRMKEFISFLQVKLLDFFWRGRVFKEKFYTVNVLDSTVDG